MPGEERLCYFFRIDYIHRYRMRSAGNLPSSNSWTHSKVTSKVKGFVKLVGLSNTTIFVKLTRDMAVLLLELNQSVRDGKKVEV